MRFLRKLSLAIILMIVSCASVEIDAKLLSKCDLLKELKKYTTNNPNFSNTYLSNWICLIENESGRNTTLVRPYIPPPNESFGLFQINSKDWCRHSFIGGHCRVLCKDLATDNLRKAVDCADLIYQREGFKAWKGWVNRCKGKPLPNINNCKLHQYAIPPRPTHHLSNNFALLGIQRYFVFFCFVFSTLRL